MIRVCDYLCYPVISGLKKDERRARLAGTPILERTFAIMNTGPQVTFTSDFFKPVPGEEEQTNPGCYGKAWATWLAERLQERGVPVEGVIPEDFGWIVMISRKPFMLWLACSNTEDSTNEWMVYPVAELSVTQRLFKRVDPAPELERLRSHLAELVPLIPGVTNIVWE